MRLHRGTVSFGRHESFPLRFGWIAKGLKAALNHDPCTFNREDATVILGVGKNMVASIRYWLQATGVGTLHALSILRDRYAGTGRRLAA